MRRASEVSPPPIGEARIAPMPFACWRAHSSERMAEPQPERALVLAHLTLHGNGICKLGAGFNLLPDCLPGNASKSCRVKKSGTSSQVSQEKRVSPMPVHGLEIVLNPACRPVSGRGHLRNLPKQPVRPCVWEEPASLQADRAFLLSPRRRKTSNYIQPRTRTRDPARGQRKPVWENHLPVTFRFPVRFCAPLSVSEASSNFRIPL